VHDLQLTHIRHEVTPFFPNPKLVEEQARDEALLSITLRRRLAVIVVTTISAIAPIDFFQLVGVEVVQVVVAIRPAASVGKMVVVGAQPTVGRGVEVGGVRRLPRRVEVGVGRLRGA
jgi:hypothetical protein